MDNLANILEGNVKVDEDHLWLFIPQPESLEEAQRRLEIVRDQDRDNSLVAAYGEEGYANIILIRANYLRYRELCQTAPSFEDFDKQYDPVEWPKVAPEYIHYIDIEIEIRNILVRHQEKTMWQWFESEILSNRNPVFRRHLDGDKEEAQAYDAQQRGNLADALQRLARAGRRDTVQFFIRSHIPLWPTRIALQVCICELYDLEDELPLAKGLGLLPSRRLRSLVDMTADTFWRTADRLAAVAAHKRQTADADRRVSALEEPIQSVREAIRAAREALIPWTIGGVASEDREAFARALDQWERAVKAIRPG